MKKISFCLLLVMLVSTACKHKTAQEELINKIKDSKTFNLYIHYAVHLTEGLKSNRYNYSQVDKKYIRLQGSSIIRDLPKKDLYAIYTTAKMTNVKDYVDTRVGLDSTFRQLFTDFPELNKMNGTQRITTLMTARRQMSDFVAKKKS